MNPKVNPIGWFEIPALDLIRAKSFYESTLQMKLDLQEMGDTRMAWFPFDESAPGCSGSLVQSQGHEPHRQGTLVYFSVDDIPACLERAVAHGGKSLLQKTSIGPYGFIGILEDTEGNRVGLHSRR